MRSQLRSTLFGNTAGEPGTESFFECTVCGSTFEEWPTACSECGQLVVRIVEPRADGA